MNRWKAQIMGEEMRKIRGSVFNDFHSVRFYDLFNKNEAMNHSINIYSSKQIINDNELTNSDFLNYLSVILGCESSESSKNTEEIKKKYCNYFANEYKMKKMSCDEKIIKVFTDILKRKQLIDHNVNITMNVNFDLQFDSNTLKSMICSGNAIKNHNNDVIIIRMIVCQKSFCGIITLNHEQRPPAYDEIDHL